MPIGYRPRHAHDEHMSSFSTARDQELCRITTARVVHRFTTALVGIIAMHRSERSADEKTCRLCRENWPCRTVMLAVSAHQEAAQ